ncbi:TPA: tail fiber domain-containing protein [Escherichia coli]
MIYTTGTIAINGNTVTGTGTNFSEPLSLIRVGCTLITISNPVQIFTITEIKSGTELSVTPAANPAIAAGTKFSILLSDSISVDGLAQDVAETLRYYQGKETEIATAVEWWNEFGGDGQMEQLLADIRAETAKSTANAQKTESDKNAAAASKTAAANSATAAKASQDAAKASETAASNSKTAAATSATNAAKSATDALNYRNQAQDIVGTSIGLGSAPRNCPDISGNPSGYIGFMRIMANATGFPSIASGEGSLTGFISQVDESPAYTGIFQGWNSRSVYIYRWAANIGPQWTKYAGLNEDGDFALSKGSFIGKTAKLLSSVDNPLTLQSIHPTIKFDETDRPEGSPDYSFIFDGGNWRIERDHWDTSKAKECISYSYRIQEIKVPNLSTQNIAIHGGKSSGTGTLRIESQKNSDEGMYIRAWGNGTDRLSVLEVSLDSGFLFYAQKVADGSKVLRVDGSITCTTVNQLSDRDLKDNIQVIGDATEAIRKMNGYTYTLKENGLPYAGVIAQEVMEALPEAVGSFTHYGKALQGPTIDGNELREETRYLNVDYAAVTGLLVQVARETDNRVTELEEENASLLANIAVMDERIAKLEELVRQLTESEK